MSGANARHGNDKMIINGLQLSTAMHVYEVRSRKDRRGVDLISDALPFGRLWYDGAGCDQLRKVFQHFRIRRNSSIPTMAKKAIQSGMSVVIASSSCGPAKARAADRALIVGSTRRIPWLRLFRFPSQRLQRFQ